MQCIVQCSAVRVQCKVQYKVQCKVLCTAVAVHCEVQLSDSAPAGRGGKLGFVRSSQLCHEPLKFFFYNYKFYLFGLTCYYILLNSFLKTLFGIKFFFFYFGATLMYMDIVLCVL